MTNLALSIYQVRSAADLPGSMVLAVDAMDAMVRYRQAMTAKVAPATLSYEPVSVACQGKVLNPLQVQPAIVPPPAWNPAQNYALDALVYDGTNVQMSVTAGISGKAQPVWNTTVGGATPDGSVTWQNQGPPGAPVPALNAYQVTTSENQNGGIVLSPMADHACCLFALTQPGGDDGATQTIQLLGPVINTVVIQYQYQVPVK